MATSVIMVALYLAVWTVATLALRLLLRGRNVEASPLALVVRTPVVFRFLDRAAGSRLIGLLLDAGILVAAVSAGLFYYSFITPFIQFISTGRTVGLVKPILPGITIGFDTFLYMLPGFSIAIILHELFHALAARHGGIPIRSSGFMIILGLLPAAFVEPDEKTLREARLRVKLRVYAAGVLANMILFAAFQALATGLSGGGYYTVIVGVDPGSPAAKAGLEPGTAVKYFIVNGTIAKGIDGLIKVLSNIQDKYNGSLAHVTLIVTMVTTKGNITIVKPASYEKIGIRMFDVPARLLYIASPQTAVAITLMLVYTIIINYSLALINAAPLFITDGAHMVRETAKIIVGEERAQTVANIVSLATLAMLIPSISL